MGLPETRCLKPWPKAKTSRRSEARSLSMHTRVLNTRTRTWRHVTTRLTTTRLATGSKNAHSAHTLGTPIHKRTNPEGANRDGQGAGRDKGTNAQLAGWR